MKVKHNEWFVIVSCSFLLPWYPHTKSHSAEAPEGEGAYLLRESCVKAGIFVLSSVKDLSVIHLAVPIKNWKFARQTFEEAYEVVNDIVNSYDGFLHPVSVPSTSAPILEGIWSF